MSEVRVMGNSSHLKGWMARAKLLRWNCWSNGWRPAIYSYVRTREPGGTPLGVEIRNLLLNRPELAITPLAEAFLFQADRAQHFAKVVIPALEQGS